MSIVEKLALITFDPICDCCCRRIIGVTTVKEARKFVQSKGKYSDYDYIEVEVGRILEGEVYC